MTSRRDVTCNLAPIQCYLEVLTNTVALILDQAPFNIHAPAGLLAIIIRCLEAERCHFLLVLQKEMIIWAPHERGRWTPAERVPCVHQSC